jgi:chromosomal replication initiator protein
VELEVSELSNATPAAGSLPARAWDAAIQYTRALSPGSFDQWFSGVQFQGLRPARETSEAATELSQTGTQTENSSERGETAAEWALSLIARDEFVRDWIKNHFMPTLLARVEAELQAAQGAQLGAAPLGAAPLGAAPLGAAPLGAAELSKSKLDLGLTSKPRVSVRWSVSKELRSPVCRPINHLAINHLATNHLAIDHTRGSTPVPSAPVPPLSAHDAAAASSDQRSSNEQRPSNHPPSNRQRPSKPYLVSLPHSSSNGSMIPSGHLSNNGGVGGGNVAAGNALNPKFTFSNFVVGTSNELAHAAAVASADGAGRRYNPLFLCGRTGLGKTHLMHAIAHRVLENRPNASVIYVSAERFTNEFIEALQHHKMEAFRARYRRECDVLLVDDIQFLTGREQTQEEFFHTFNVMHEAGKAIVLSSDKYPQDLQRMPERLISRFNSGLVADVHVPELETRVAIVRKKADLEGIPLSDEVAVLLAQTVKSNVRELEGALIRLAAKSSLTRRSIDEEFARSELASGLPRQAEVQSVEDIQRAVCSHFRLSNADLLSKDRHKSVAFARQVAMYLCRQRLKCSFPELGRAFGNRDHTTVMSAVRRVEALRQTDPQVNAHIEAIAQKLA